MRTRSNRCASRSWLLAAASACALSFGAATVVAQSEEEAEPQPVAQAEAAEEPAAPEAPPAAEEPPPAEAPPAEAPAPSAPLKRIGNPALLSDSVRARLERNAARHAANLPLLNPGHPRDPRDRERGRHAPGALRTGAGGAAPAAEAAPSAEATGVESSPPVFDEPHRRGDAKMRSMQALEADGVTVLSNRVELPAARPERAARRLHEVERPAAASEDEVAEPEAPEEESARASSVTETRSLRTVGSRPVKAKYKARNESSSTGWLLWPLGLFVATGAVIGTLWYRKKT